jgi:DNA-binding CsgD family transcriptional regulator
MRAGVALSARGVCGPQDEEPQPEPTAPSRIPAGRPNASDPRAAPSCEPSEVLRSITAALPVAALLIDGRGRVLWMNRQAEARLRTLEASAGRTWRTRAAEDLGRCVAQPDARRPDWLRAGESLIVRPVEPAGLDRRVLVTLVPSAVRRMPSVESVRSALSLSARESEVALLAAQGFSTVNIACRLEITEWTVRAHLRRLYRKTGVCTRAELACRVLGVQEHELGHAAASTSSLP